jgi:hypothetical protein
MNKTLYEIAKFTGKACGTVVKDLAEISQPLGEAFREGWREAMSERPAAQAASSPAGNAAQTT